MRGASMVLNVLRDPVVRVTSGNGIHETLSIPAVYEALMLDQVEAFPALRPHQRHPWHAFLTQLGAIALHRAGRDEPPVDATDWRGLLRKLTSDWPEDEPWHLSVPDITKPAFLQPPAASADSYQDYKKRVPTPDGIDLLVTSRNHDLKRFVAVAPEPDDWLFALISLQTSAGYPGRGYYGISRMNGGNGSRPSFSLTPSTRPGSHFRRDTWALLEVRGNLLAEYSMRGDGIALLWTEPWDGQKTEAVSLNTLDPFYIEVCRRIRLRLDTGGNLQAVRATSAATRIHSKNMKGVVGDPWTPINVKEHKSLTLSQLGFGYRRVADYLSSDWRQPPIFVTKQERARPQPMILIARGIAGGQGKTGGYHERIVPFKEKAITALLSSEGVKEFGDIARERIEQVGRIQRVLRHAIATFLARGDKPNSDHYDLASRWTEKLDETVDAGFFEDLEEEHAAESAEDRALVRRRWLWSVISVARALGLQAYDSLPCSALHRYRARVRAENVFEGRLRGRNGFPWLFDRKEPSNDDRFED